MPAEDLNSDAQASSRDPQREPHRRPAGPRRVPAVTFGLGVAALAGVVVAAAPPAEGATAVNATRTRAETGAQAAAAAGPDAAINQLIGESTTSCTTLTSSSL